MPAKTAPWRWLVALLGLSVGLGAALSMFGRATGGDLLFLVLLGLVVVGLTALGVWLMAMYWRGIDEAAREAHKWAWFWGGNVALIPAAFAFAILIGRPDTAVPLLSGLRATPAHYAAMGGLMVLLLLMVGYAVAWIGWWLWRNRQ